MQMPRAGSIDETFLNGDVLLDAGPASWDTFSDPSCANVGGSVVLDPMIGTTLFSDMMPLDFFPDFQVNPMPLELTTASAPIAYSQEYTKL